MMDHVCESTLSNHLVDSVHTQEENIVYSADDFEKGKVVHVNGG